MTYRVVFDVNCAYLDLVEADSKEEAVDYNEWEDKIFDV